MYKRPQFQVLIERLKEPRKFIQVVTGPRQVGKTTMVQQIINEISAPSIYITADGIANTNELWLEQQWENARLKLKSNQYSELIFVVDEIQKIKNWSEIVKASWDADNLNNINIKLIILGSSRLLIQKGLTESLAGRFETIYLGHWGFPEMNSAFGFDENQFVWFGGYPGAASLIKDETRWKDYVLNSLVETTISKDILLTEQINKPALLRNLFELGCSYSGQILSFNKILGQLQDAGNTTTLSNYLRLLDNAGLLSGLEKFSKGKIVQRSSSPKFQVQNTALLSVLSDNAFSEMKMNSESWGRHIESVIGVHLLNESRNTNMKIFYWRDGNYEVDFVLEYKNKIIGLEVKSGNSKYTNGMNQFKQKFAPNKMYLISENGLSWKEFIKLNPFDLF